MTPMRWHGVTPSTWQPGKPTAVVRDATTQTKHNPVCTARSPRIAHGEFKRLLKGATPVPSAVDATVVAAMAASTGQGGAGAGGSALEQELRGGGRGGVGEPRTLLQSCGQVEQVSPASQTASPQKGDVCSGEMGVAPILPLGTCFGITGSGLFSST